jgi:hypothetical protein
MKKKYVYYIMTFNIHNNKFELKNLDIGNEINRKKKSIVINGYENVDKNIIYISVQYNNVLGINLKVINAKVLEVNRKKCIIRVVINNNDDTLFIDKLKEIEEGMIEKMDKLGVYKNVRDNFISNVMKVDDKNIMSFSLIDDVKIYDKEGVLIKNFGVLYGLDVNCDIKIMNIQVIDHKWTYGIMMERCDVISGDIKEICGEILEDEYFF